MLKPTLYNNNWAGNTSHFQAYRQKKQSLSLYILWVEAKSKKNILIIKGTVTKCTDRIKHKNPVIKWFKENNQMKLKEKILWATIFRWKCFMLRTNFASRRTFVRLRVTKKACTQAFLLSLSVLHYFLFVPKRLWQNDLHFVTASF